MRVAAVESLLNQPPAQLTAINDPAIDRALRNFLTALATDDSLFTGEMLGTVVGVSAGGEEATCSGDFALRFREANLADNRNLNFSLLEKLSELLRQAGSSDALTAHLSLSPQSEPGKASGGLVLRLRLEASGNSTEQATLRWGLGLAHVQQAVLFTARYLRQQLAQNRD